MSGPDEYECEIDDTGDNDHSYYFDELELVHDDGPEGGFSAEEVSTVCQFSI